MAFRREAFEIVWRGLKPVSNEITGLLRQCAWLESEGVMIKQQDLCCVKVEKKKKISYIMLFPGRI